jgi:NitT/TauT family transport system substrate-binding protein
MRQPLRPFVRMSAFVRISAFAIAAALGAAAAGPCHADETVHVGIVNSTTDAPFFIADAKGYFQDEGLKADFIAFDSAAKMVPVLGTGELDAGGGAVSSALYNAVARGVEMKVIADKAHHDPDFGHAALMVRKELIDSGKFKDYADLRGLKVAVSGAGSSDESVLNEALKRGGMKWGDATVIYMGFPQHPAAYVNGAIDAGLTAEPALTNSLKTGAATLFARIGKFYPNQQSAVLIFGANFLKGGRETGRKFVRAYIRAARFYDDAIVDGALTGPTASEVIAILTKYTPIKNPDVYKVTTPPAINPDGKLNLDSMRKDWQFFKDTHQIDGSATVDQVVDLSFVDDALGKLGLYHPAAAK